jgi:hypothetical protein
LSKIKIMKELVIEIQESEYAFIAKLLQQFSFVKIKENNTVSNKPLLATTKTSYLFSPKNFDELYDKVMDDNVDSSEILAEFEKRKIIESQYKSIFKA